jgi:hypothetical protein
LSAGIGKAGDDVFNFDARLYFECPICNHGAKDYITGKQASSPKLPLELDTNSGINFAR